MSLADQKKNLFGAKSKGNANTVTKQPTSTASITIASATTASAATHVSKTTGTKIKATTESSGTLTISNNTKLKKIDEAKEWSEKGMKFLKKSLFQWSPDYVAAAPCFEKAAINYKLAGEYNLARLMYIQAVECNEKGDMLNAGAQCYIRASEIAIQNLNNCKLCCEYLINASELYGINGDIDKSADMLFKAAKTIENEDNDDDNDGNEHSEKKALQLYMDGINRMFPIDTPKDKMDKIHPNILDMLRYAFKFLIKCKMYNDAIAFAEDRMVDMFEAFEQEKSMCNIMLTITMIQLSLGDIVGADKTFVQKHLGNSHYLKSNECRLAENFIMSMKHCDVDKFEDAKKQLIAADLDRETKVLGNSLTLLGDGGDLELTDTYADDVSNQIKDILAFTGGVTAEVAAAAVDTVSDDSDSDEVHHVDVEEAEESTAVEEVVISTEEEEEDLC